MSVYSFHRFSSSTLIFTINSLEDCPICECNLLEYNFEFCYSEKEEVEKYFQSDGKIFYGQFPS